MRKILTFSLLLATVLSMQAQSFVFMRNEETLPNDAAFETSETTDFPVLLMESELSLVNLTTMPLNLRVSQTVIAAPMAPTTQLSFCFEECFNTNENKSIDGVLPAKGSEFFHVYLALEPNHNETVIVKYEAENRDNPSEKRAVTVTYKYEEKAGLKMGKSEDRFNIYRQGEQVILNVQGNGNETIQATVCDLTGRVSVSQMLSASGQFPLATGLQKGIYLLTLKEGDALLSTQKFIIQ